MKQHPYLEYFVRGTWGDIECLVNVTHFHHQPADRSCTDSDMDYRGFTEVEFGLLHLDGTPAPELEELMDIQKVADIEEMIIANLWEN
jgi:hypothetical protein